MKYLHSPPALLEINGCVLQTDENPQPLPEGVTAHAGAKGADCDSACADAGLHCAPEAVQAISSCDLLREHFECEAGCSEAKESTEAPAYVVYGTPKALYPTMCFTASAGVEMGSCSAAQPHMQRLCACAPWKAAGEIMSIEAGAENGQQQDRQQGGAGDAVAESGGVNTEDIQASGNGTVQASSVGDVLTADSGALEEAAADSNRGEGQSVGSSISQ